MDCIYWIPKQSYTFRVYSTIGSAIAARKDAEEKIYGGFIEEFKKEHPERWKIIEESHKKAQKRKQRQMKE